jgi:serine/threonine protein kinase
LHKPHTEKSDLYSLGIVIWEIFAEDHPYMQELNKEQMSVQDLIGKILNENYRPLNSKNGDEKYLFALPEIYDLMTRLWHKNCLSRPEWRSIVDVLESMKVTSRSMKNNARDRRSTTSWTDASSFRELSHSKFRPEPELRAPEETHTTEDQVVIPNFKFTFMTDSELDDHPFEESEPQQTMPLRITASFYHSTIMSSPDAAKNPIEKSKALGTSD